MLRKLSHSALVLATLVTGVLGASALSATPAAASGVSIGVTIGAPEVQLVRHRRGHRPQAGRGGLCNPQQALRKADRLGVNRARLVRVDRRGVVVQGRSRGDRVQVRFAQARGCPVLGYR